MGEATPDGADIPRWWGHRQKSVVKRNPLYPACVSGRPKGDKILFIAADWGRMRRLCSRLLHPSNVEQLLTRVYANPDNG